MRIFSLISIVILVLSFVSCKKDSTTTIPAQVKQFTFFSPGGNCGGRVQSGNFIAGRPLSSSKTISIQVNVAAVGPFQIHTNTVNGISFNKSDTFKTTGVQTVVLQGSGTPLTAGANNYIMRSSSGDSCTTYATVISGIAIGALTCKIDGIVNNFSTDVTGSLMYNPGADLKIAGGLADGTNNFFEIQLQHPTLNPLTAGTYTVNTAGFYVKGLYTDAALNSWVGQTETTAQTNPFTITITSISETDVTGTFSGQIKDNGGAGPGFKTITEGAFSFIY